MRTLQVHFSSGKEVLGRYWGMLRGGGLRLDLPMLPEAPLLAPPPVWTGEPTPHQPTTHLPVDAQRGERLRLQVHVRTIKKMFPVLAQILELTSLPVGLRAVFGFLPESPPDDLLDAVWADGLNVPQRRTRRQSLRMPVRFACVSAGDGSLRPGELRNLSLGGCCIAGAALPPLGSHVMVQIAEDPLPSLGTAATLNISGRVRWTERPAAGLMGIEFQSASAALAQLLQSLPAQLLASQPHA